MYTHDLHVFMYSDNDPRMWKPTHIRIIEWSNLTIEHHQEVSIVLFVKLLQTWLLYVDEDKLGGIRNRTRGGFWVNFDAHTHLRTHRATSVVGDQRAFNPAGQLSQLLTTYQMEETDYLEWRATSNIWSSPLEGHCGDCRGVVVFNLEMEISLTLVQRRERCSLGTVIF